MESQSSCDNFTYRHVTYSHDQVDFNLIDHVIAERGEIVIQDRVIASFDDDDTPYQG
ncbi:MAG: hypothetical protein KJP23_29185 [Deltaproteobacteria bacterium]|nr:hypothetical protein [Deltaproteobacteria bacterium]